MTIPKQQKRRKQTKVLTKKEWSTIFADLIFCNIADFKTADTIIQNRRRNVQC